MNVTLNYVSTTERNLSYENQLMEKAANDVLELLEKSFGSFGEDLLNGCMDEEAIEKMIIEQAKVSDMRLS